MARKDYIKNLSNKELEIKLCEADYCDRDLMKEYDDRRRDGRIRLSGIKLRPEDLPEFFKKRREIRVRKKAS